MRSKGAAGKAGYGPPSSMDTAGEKRFSVWFFAFGYFACYVPYSALTKAITKGTLPGQSEPIAGLSIVPLSVLASVVGMFVAFTWLGWWRYTVRSEVFGLRVPVPTRWTLLSGIATGAIVITTTLAYSFSGVSIPFMMLLMRGGVLMLAPIVDALSGRRVRWFSWVALGMSLLALVDAVTVAKPGAFPMAAVVDVALYLAGYFVRLRFMSRLAKSKAEDEARRYFVEEQMVATPLLVFVLLGIAFLGHGQVAEALRFGFVGLWGSWEAWVIVAIGIFSQGTGFFGGLVLLDANENSFCVPLNRASSVLAGVIASFALAAWAGEKAPSVAELVGAALLVGAIVVLWFGPRWKRFAAAADPISR
jgi:hypothetical protein